MTEAICGYYVPPVIKVAQISKHLRRMHGTFLPGYAVLHEQYKEKCMKHSNGLSENNEFQSREYKSKQ